MRFVPSGRSIRRISPQSWRRVPRPRMLVSTPCICGRCSAPGWHCPRSISSSAPRRRSRSSSRSRSRRGVSTRLLEIYGSTETGEIALRRPTHSPEWQLWPGVTLSARDGETWAQGGHIEQPTRMCDVLEMTGRDTFLLHGRVADLVNIAGKRSSLGYLNHQLNCIPGVLDGAFFHTDEERALRPSRGSGPASWRPELIRKHCSQQLRLRIDPAFLPRPLLLVARLPRNSTGKLPQAALQIAGGGESQHGRRRISRAARANPDHWRGAPGTRRPFSRYTHRAGRRAAG